MPSILIVGIIIFTGFVFGEIAQIFKLPRITGYILAGIFLNPSIFDIIPLEFVNSTKLIVNISLSFITFSVGGTLLFSKIKHLGKSVMYITIFEAEMAFIFVFLGFILFLPFFMNGEEFSWTIIIPISILIGSLASPTDPSATLAVMHEYKANGPVSSTIMGVAVFDDVFGIINYSIAIAIASIILLKENFSFVSVLHPLVIIAASVLIGIIMGTIFNFITKILNKESDGELIIIIMGILMICFGIANLLKADELLSTMVMGIIVVNYNRDAKKIFQILERYTEEFIFVLFFTISGMQLNPSILVKYYFIVIAFVLMRAFGKYVGTFIGSHIVHTPHMVKKYTFMGLIPQGGIVVGLALLINQNRIFSGISDIVLNVIIGAVVIHELIGPVLAKIALKKSKEIKL